MEFWQNLGIPETRRLAIQYGLDSLTIATFFSVLTHCQTVTDGRTDRRTDISTTDKTALCNVSLPLGRKKNSQNTCRTLLLASALERLRVVCQRCPQISAIYLAPAIARKVSVFSRLCDFVMMSVVTLHCYHSTVQENSCSCGRETFRINGHMEHAGRGAIFAVHLTCDLSGTSAYAVVSN